MITLEPKEFINELEAAFWLVFNSGFILGLSLGCFIAMSVYIKYRD